MLVVHQLTKRYGTLQALDGIDLVVKHNSFHGLIGPNGSGKSTFLKAIAGAHFPTSGTIRFNDKDITDANPYERARMGLSLKFQITAVLDELSVFDNVLLAVQAANSLWSLLLSKTRSSLRDQVMHALERFQLAERSNELAGVLSHGEQQWLEIAMALAVRPKLLLLDEPTAGMSPEERRITGDLLRPIKQECSILIVEHDLDFIREISDEITILDQGKVLDTGSVEEIQRSTKAQQAYTTRV
ncbi:MAG: ABC transporter ATP-binding protein [Betaproteobacteria bacterium]|nr:ABC transporter ATP-binding protein [Betaproteobacteria bacterium]NBP39262.1 ABC transporter ATP-binding protein [Betaproteobacteria bacterium]NBQ79497.1 ABC transporter ATP-binding protein [Betaproteobacteria bacterium]NBS40059.1 ABC transporter ATP-binding protein [Betaproteobacteria bacterium]NBT82350.1 ABC transporter ATP-binding protein [Betaproteobacteria bacterium]